MPTMTTYVPPSSLGDEITDDELQSVEMAEIEIDLIELAANASITPFTHTLVVRDTFNDATGYLNTVTTANSSALFSTNKYIRTNSNATDAHGVTFGSTPTADNTQRMGITIKPKRNINTLIVTKTAGTAAVKCGIFNHASHATVEIVDFSGNTATFTPATTLTAGVEYDVLVWATAGNWQYSALSSGISFPYTGTNLDFTGDMFYDDPTYTEGTAVVRAIVSIQSNSDVTASQVVEIALPALAGTITDTQLVVSDPDRESGDNITYKLIDSAENSDDNLAVETKNALVNCLGTNFASGAKLQIQLKPKAGSPTTGKPSVKSYALKLWT